MSSETEFTVRTTNVKTKPVNSKKLQLNHPITDSGSKWCLAQGIRDILQDVEMILAIKQCMEKLYLYISVALICAMESQKSQCLFLNVCIMTDNIHRFYISAYFMSHIVINKHCWSSRIVEKKKPDHLKLLLRVGVCDADADG